MAFVNTEGNTTIWQMNRFTINAFHGLGDVNNDGETDLRDAIIVLQASAGSWPSGLRPDYVTSLVDVNGDNKIGLAEVLYILQIAAGVRN